MTSLSDRDATILTLRETTGATAGWIARELGVTRNTVVGVLYRNGNPKHVPRVANGTVPSLRPPPAPPRGGHRFISRRTREKRIAKAAVIERPIPVAEPRRPIRHFACLSEALLDADMRFCLWPVTEAEGHRYCGDTIAVTSYCAEHHRLSIGRGTEGERRVGQPSFARSMA